MTNVGYAHGMVHLTTSKKRRSKFYPNWTKPYNSRAHCRADNKTSGWCEADSSKKDLPTYSRIFEVLHSKAEELGIELAPTKFVCDFETALILTIEGNYLS
ncbi:hypothetical protein T05_4697 [Trichinella murrelli]|uniref:Uncharacterized protein n=1 Tax=Trichinella murrelli TaxID=144512 RepID=A0A0V0TA19_9BILA|nr:hypothetical protein T05_4697 [Trichinella murrelli]